MDGRQKSRYRTEQRTVVSCCGMNDAQEADGRVPMAGNVPKIGRMSAEAGDEASIQLEKGRIKIWLQEIG